MANKNQDWDDLGRSIQDIVDKAVNSHDYQKLNQTVCQAVGKAVDMGSEAVRKAMEAAARPAPQPARPVYREVEATVVEEKKDLPALYAGTGGETAVGLVKIVGGGIIEHRSKHGLWPRQANKPAQKIGISENMGKQGHIPPAV